MGAWSEDIDGNDSFQDVYQRFFELYNGGENPVDISEQILEEFADEFCDYDDKHNSLFGLALAQWETKSLTISVFSQVEEVIKSGSNLEFWQSSEIINSKILDKRRKALNKFLSKISVKKARAKRRSKEKFEFTNVELVKIVAPDNQKVFETAEHFVNGIYQQTGSSIMWASGGGSVFYFTEQGKTIQAHWIDAETLKIIHDVNIIFTKQDYKFFYCGDSGSIIYEPIA